MAGVVNVRYRVQHTSRYEYDRGVTASFNEARLTPKQTPWQVTLESSLFIDPVTWTYRYTDYWGTDVRVFEAITGHRALTVRASSLVEVDASRRPVPRELEWAELAEPGLRDEHAELLVQTPATEPPDELAAIATELAAVHSPADTARLIGETVHAGMTYRTGVTEVHTTAAEAWSERVGVCQDYAHLVVGAMRHVGLPARYVSGYLHPASEPQIGDPAQGESHAWVETWLGEWAPQDPTNLAPVTDRHLMIGTGRDYGDVPPIKGIVAGPHESADLTVVVELTRLA